MKTIIIAFGILCYTSVSAQEFLDTMAVRACACVKEIDIKNLDPATIELELGLCVMKDVDQFREQIKTELKIDFNTGIGEENGRRFGEIIGARMASICSDFFLKLHQQGFLDNEEEEAESITIEANIRSINKGQFITVTAEDGKKRKYNLIWLFAFENSYDLLQDQKTLKNKKVDISYKEMDLFDPNIEEYRKFKVITSINWK